MQRDPEVARAIPAEELEELFRPENSFGAAAAMIERVLADWQAARSFR